VGVEVDGRRRGKGEVVVVLVGWWQQYLLPQDNPRCPRKDEGAPFIPSAGSGECTVQDLPICRRKESGHENRLGENKPSRKGSASARHLARKKHIQNEPKTVRKSGGK
jgi:hypothetical protein